MRIGIGTKTADDTENAAIATIEAGTARTGAEPRRRVKVCVQHENGDEYCRYRQGR